MKNPNAKSKTYIELLKDDHAKVKALFKKFEKTNKDEVKESIVKNILKELTVHAAAEEEVIYPDLRKAVKEDLMDEADVEHAVAKGLIAELQNMKPGDDHYDAKVTVLGELIDHHVKEEEDEIFPQAAKKVKNSEMITARLIARKKVLMEEVTV